jgi:hypothetical protein
VTIGFEDSQVSECKGFDAPGTRHAAVEIPRLGFALCSIYGEICGVASEATVKIPRLGFAVYLTFVRPS